MLKHKNAITWYCNNIEPHVGQAIFSYFSPNQWPTANHVWFTMTVQCAFSSPRAVVRGSSTRRCRRGCDLAGDQLGLWCWATPGAKVNEGHIIPHMVHIYGNMLKMLWHQPEHVMIAVEIDLVSSCSRISQAIIHFGVDDFDQTHPCNQTDGN